MHKYIEQSDVTDRLLNECLRPSSKELAIIMASGRLACVVFEPDDQNAAAAMLLGWDGVSSVFSMPDGLRTALAKAVSNTDPVCSAWLRDNQSSHVFVIIKHGLLLVNYDHKNNAFHLVDPPAAECMN